MKKKYVNPVTETFSSELSNVICGSQYSINGNGSWGGSGDYAPDEWINEGHGEGSTGGYTTDPISDDEEDLPSRSKGGNIFIWDDEGW